MNLTLDIASNIVISIADGACEASFSALPSKVRLGTPVEISYGASGHFFGKVTSWSRPLARLDVMTQMKATSSPTLQAKFVIAKGVNFHTGQTGPASATTYKLKRKGLSTDGLLNARDILTWFAELIDADATLMSGYNIKLKIPSLSAYQHIYTGVTDTFEKAFIDVVQKEYPEAVLRTHGRELEVYLPSESRKRSISLAECDDRSSLSENLLDCFTRVELDTSDIAKLEAGISATAKQLPPYVSTQHYTCSGDIDSTDDLGTSEGDPAVAIVCAQDLRRIISTGFGGDVFSKYRWHNTMPIIDDAFGKVTDGADSTDYGLDVMTWLNKMRRLLSFPQFNGTISLRSLRTELANGDYISVPDVPDLANVPLYVSGVTHDLTAGKTTLDIGNPDSDILDAARAHVVNLQSMLEASPYSKSKKEVQKPAVAAANKRVGVWGMWTRMYKGAGH